MGHNIEGDDMERKEHSYTCTYQLVDVRWSWQEMLEAAAQSNTEFLIIVQSVAALSCKRTSKQRC
jgi:hypothetical protein